MGRHTPCKERSLFQSQQYATTRPRSGVQRRGCKGSGYEIDRGKHGQPEIKGYTQEVSGRIESASRSNPNTYRR